MNFAMRILDVPSIFHIKAAPYRSYVYAACTVLAVTLNYTFGKEMAWDLLHYHFYPGFSALNDRFEQDYFAAGSPIHISIRTPTCHFISW